MRGWIRNRIRALRFFYKPDCRELYRRHLADPWRALLFPVAGGGRFVFRDGTPLWLPPRYFGMLATACRLKELGAAMEWSDDEMSLRFRDFRFFAPPDTKLAPLSLQSFLVEDVWRTGRTDLEGKTLLDVGAHVGFFSVVCAKRGATVHAFEPFPIFQEFIRRNAVENGVADRITIHGVGLSDRDRSIDSAEFLDGLASQTHGSWKRRGEVPQVSLVDSVRYLKRHGIGPVHFLKLNCEGCEYPLLQDARFLEGLRPRFISLEYHDGGTPLFEILDRAGYEVQWGSDDPEQRARKKGKMFAARREGEEPPPSMADSTPATNPVAGGPFPLR